MTLSMQIVLGAVLASLLALFSFSFRLLTARGALAQAVVGCLVFGLGGWQWAVPIVCFFLFSSLLARMTRSAKRPGSELFAKGETRDAFQVAANGGLAAGLVVPWFLTGLDLFYAGYVAAVAAAAADTWATDIGLCSGRRPRSIRTLQSVDPGQSGGITWVGVSGAALGALTVTFAALPWLQQGTVLVPIVAGAGFLSSVLDSVLGATLQIQYRCAVCCRMTERPSHCGAEAMRVRGRDWVTNDTVNFLASSSGALLAMLLCTLLIEAGP